MKIGSGLSTTISLTFLNLIVSIFFNQAKAQCAEDTIREISDNGSVIVMVSALAYSIDAGDQPDAMAWLPGEDVFICVLSNSEITIINQDQEGARVSAEEAPPVGSQPSASSLIPMLTPMPAPIPAPAPAAAAPESRAQYGGSLDRSQFTTEATEERWRKIANIVKASCGKDIFDLPQSERPLLIPGDEKNVASFYCR